MLLAVPGHRKRHHLLGKPDGAAILNRGSAQARGLVAWYPVMHGAAVQDKVGGLVVPYVAGTGLNRLGGQLGLNAATANDLGAHTLAGTRVQNLLPASIMCVFWQDSGSAPGGTVQPHGTWFGISHNNTDSSPYWNYVLKASGGGDQISFEWNNAGVHTTMSATSGLPSAKQLHVLIATIATGAQVIYLDGASIASAANAVASISSGATSSVCLGMQPGTTGRSPGSYLVDCRVYDRAISADEARQFSVMWGDLYAGPLAFWPRRAAAAAAARAQRLALLGVG